MKKIFFRTLTFLTMFLLFSCGNILQDNPKENMSQGTARLKLSIAGAKNESAKTIFAPDVDMTAYTYELKGKKQGLEEETIVCRSDTDYFSGKWSFTYSELLSTEFLIEMGTWEYFTLNATKGSSKYSATLTNVEIVQGTNKLAFEMDKNPGRYDYGSVDVTLNLPKDADVAEVKAGIFNLDETVYNYNDYRTLAISNYLVKFSTTILNAGMYILSFKFFSVAGTEIKPGYSELIQVEAGLTSTAERTIESLEKLHSIDWNLNGGKISGDSIPSSFMEQETIALPNETLISRKGYVFEGWYTTAEFSGDAVTEIPSGTRSDVALFAKWIPISYIITYQGVDGATNDNPATYTIEDEITLASPKKTAALFKEWLLNGKSITSIPKDTTGDIVLVAKWRVLIELSAEEAVATLAQKISAEEFAEEFSIKINGNLTSDQLSSIATIIKNSKKNIELDLSEATGLDTIKSSTFSGCANLESIVIPKGVTSIGDYAFLGCTKLTTIAVPSTLAKIGLDAFKNCSALTTINCASVSSWKKIEFGNTFGDDSWKNPLNPLRSNITAYVNGKDVTTEIYTYKITYSGLSGASNSNPSTYDSRKGLTLEKPVRSGVKFDYWTLNEKKVTEVAVGTKADITLTANWCSGFYDTAKNAASGKLKQWLSNQSGVGPFEVYLTGELTSEYLKSIAAALNEYPKKLVKLDLSETSGLTKIGEFEYCKSLETIVIPKGVTEISMRAFSSCENLTDITIPSTVNYIDDYAFQYCNSLTNVYLDDIASWCGVKFGTLFHWDNPIALAAHLFVNGKENKNIIIPEGVKTIESCAFKGGVTCIESVTIPGSMTTIANGAFSDCTGLKTVIIKNGAKEIGSSAFEGCSSLTNITIPSSVTEIGSRAFYHCDTLNAVYINSLENWCAIDFGSSSANPLYYAKNLYVDGTKATNLVIRDNVKNINKYAFYNCTSLTSVTIGSGVTLIGNNAFYGCTNLTSATFKDTVGWSKGGESIVVTDATTNAAKLREGGSGNWGDSELRKK